jgi:EmrB/QacA subfamily drug resistance transporter
MYKKRRINRPLVLASIMLSSFMTAVESTIVSTAMPMIVSDLGNFSLYSWVFSSYLLMMTVTILIYGKLADIFGRKPVMLFGILLFLIGSFLCGLADSMEMLILFRFIQGIGAGAVSPIATTIVGDIYRDEERGKVQGYLQSVWGISAVLGPIMGGILVEYMGWQYVFWINVPLGIFAFIGFSLFLHEDIEKNNQVVDYRGAFYLVVFVSILMFLFIEGGVSWGWISWQATLLLLLSSAFFILFLFRSKKVNEPIVPINLWKDHYILIANMISFTTGIILIGIASFLPTYVQGLMGMSPIVAGFTLTTMSIGWPIASTIAGKLLFKVGFEKITFVGCSALIVGGLFFTMMTPDKGPLWAAFGSFLIGIGMGLTGTAFIVTIQNVVSWEQRGIATALNLFMRNLGNAMGAAFLGGILNSRLHYYFQKNDAGDLSIDSVNLLLGLESNDHLTKANQLVLINGLTEGLHTVFVVVGIIALINFIVYFFFSKRKSKDNQQ